jgi:hypothetical protein
MSNVVASPAATGPLGAHFESKVAAFYLLAMLLDAEPRGLPGTRINKIQFQGAGDGFPLDDVIVHATSFTGDVALLEIQVKHKITFSPGDAVFEKIVGQITETLKAGNLVGASPHAVAIATAQGSRQIDGAYHPTPVAQNANGGCIPTSHPALLTSFEPESRCRTERERDDRMS